MTLNDVPKNNEFVFDDSVPDSYKELIYRCCSDNVDERPTFSEIIYLLYNDERFITDDMDIIKFENFVESISTNNNPLDKEMQDVTSSTCGSFVVDDSSSKSSIKHKGKKSTSGNSYGYDDDENEFIET